MSESNEFDQTDLPNDGSYQEPSSGAYQGAKKKKTFNFKAVLADGTSKRTLLIVLGIAVVGIGIAFWPHGHKQIPKTATGSVPQLSTPQGSQVPSQQYSNELQQANNQRAQQALQSGGSALPTMQLPPSTSAPPPDLGQGGYSAQQPPPPPPPILPSSPPTPQVVNTQSTPKTYPVYNIQPNQSQTQNMVQYMAKLSAGAPTADLIEFPSHTSAGSGASGQEGGDGGYSNASSVNNPQTPSAVSESMQNQQAQGPFSAPVVGTILYSVLISGADSDAPGPVLGEVEQGALSGARLLGGFTTSAQGMTITFKTMVVPYKDAEGATQTQVLPIDAIAVDTSTMNNNVATSVNNHIAERLGVAFVSSLMGNFGQLISQNGASTVVSATGSIATSNPNLSTKKQLESAAGQAAGQAGQIFNQIYGDKPTTIKTAPGTPFGLLFLANNN